MEQEQIYISLSPEAEALLADNSVDLVEELAKEGHQVRKGYGKRPSADDENQTKDVSLIILASAAAFGTVSMGIAHILTVLANKPVVVKNKKSIPIQDASGDVKRDSDGQPIMQEEETETLVTPDTPIGSGISAELGNLFRFEFATGKGGSK